MHNKIKLNTIKLNPQNPRLIKDDKFRKLCESLKSFPEMLDLRPIIVDNENVVIGGNMRLNALKELGYKEIPETWIKKASELNEAQKREFIIKDNLPFGEWDYEILANEFNIDELLKFGFDEKDLDVNFWDEKSDEELNDVPEIPKTAQSKLGDIFLIDGKHRVMCGDSTKESDVSVLMNGKKANLYFTDPPYGVDYAGKNEFLNKCDKGNCIQRDIIQDKEITPIKDSFIQARNILEETASYYIFSAAGGELMMMMMMMNEAGLPHKHMIIWVKNNHVLGRTDYNYKHEPIHYGWVKTHKFYGGGEQKFSVWNYDKPLRNDLHPTMKPVALVVNAINNSSMSNCIVYDSFLGSGSTLVASEQTNRVCYGMELDPIYVDVILKRYHKLYHDKEIKCLNREFDFNALYTEN